MSQSTTPLNPALAKKDRKEPSGAAPGRFVTDSTATNSRQLLNAYIYDFLIKSGLSETAKAFVLEADVPTTNTPAPGTLPATDKTRGDLPSLRISMDAPQGFLYEWWQIFWDVFNARTHRAGSGPAQQYFQLQLLRQRREHALHSMTAHAAHAQAHGQTQPQSQTTTPVPQPQPMGPMLAAKPLGSLSSPSKRQRLASALTPMAVSASPLASHAQAPMVMQNQFNPQFMFKQPAPSAAPTNPYANALMDQHVKMPMQGNMLAGQNGMMSGNGNGNGANYTAINANLQEYQNQLMLMERQNRMMMDHDPSADFLQAQPATAIPNQRWQQLQQQQMPPPANVARNTPTVSPATIPQAHPVDGAVKTPVVANMPTPTTSGGPMAAVIKKKPPVKRPRKASKTNPSEPPTPTTPMTPANAHTTPQLQHPGPPKKTGSVSAPSLLAQNPKRINGVAGADAPTHIDPTALRSPSTTMKKEGDTPLQTLVSAEEPEPKQEPSRTLMALLEPSDAGDRPEDTVNPTFMQESHFLTDISKVQGVAPDDMDFDFNNFLDTGENDHGMGQGSASGFEGVFGWTDGA